MAPGQQAWSLRITKLSSAPKCCEAPTACAKCLEIPGLGTLGTAFNLPTSRNLKCDIFEYRCPGLLNKEEQFPCQYHPINLKLIMLRWPRAGRMASIATKQHLFPLTETWLHPYYRAASEIRRQTILDFVVLAPKAQLGPSSDSPKEGTLVLPLQHHSP